MITEEEKRKLKLLLNKPKPSPKPLQNITVMNSFAKTRQEKKIIPEKPKPKSLWQGDDENPQLEDEIHELIKQFIKTCSGWNGKKNHVVFEGSYNGIDYQLITTHLIC